MLPHSYAFTALGTSWDITTTHALSSQLQLAIVSTIETFDKTYSRFRPDSLVTAIATRSGEYTFPETAIPLFDLYKNLYDQTDGKMTPLIGAVLERAGYDATYSLTPRTQRPVPSWDDALTFTGYQLLTTMPVTLDVGAAGKGYLVDIVSHILDNASVLDYVIDASGDLKHKGTTDNTVGLEHPYDPTKIIGTVNVQNQSLAASAVTRRAWGDGLHHIFDPDTQEPTRQVVATWVIADKTMTADGLATALFFTEPQKLQTICRFQYVRLHDDGHLDYSMDFEGQLF